MKNLGFSQFKHDRYMWIYELIDVRRLGMNLFSE